MKYGLLVLAALFAVWLAVILIRGALFRPKAQPRTESNPVDFDKDAAVARLASLVRCRTVSNVDSALEDEAQFQKLTDSLPQLYPHVFARCTPELSHPRAVLLRWPGKESNDPTVLMAHYDVVPVEEENWDKPPFEAIIEDGVMWGRGTLDTKVTLNGILSAADTLIAQGFCPEKDIYLAFSGGEEVNGPGAPAIVSYFKSKGIRPGLVVDEGGAVVEGVFPGVKQPCGLIGIAEKGMLNAQFRCLSSGGHASAPLPHSPVDTLSGACLNVLKKPMAMHIQGPAGQMFDTLGRWSGFGYRVLFANLWCFAPVLDLLCRLKGGELNALVRTTVAFTQMQGSKARNVIPPEASMVANIRLNPSDSVASTLAHLRKASGVEVTNLESFEPSPISQIDCPAWDKVASAVANTWPGCLVSPYLMVQCSDSRHYRDISNHVYRFSAMALTSQERSTIHGNNERIRLESIHRSVEFFLRLIAQC